MFGEILQSQIGQPIFGVVHLRDGVCCFAIGRGAEGAPRQRGRPWDPSRPAPRSRRLAPHSVIGVLVVALYDLVQVARSCAAPDQRTQ